MSLAPLPWLALTVVLAWTSWSDARVRRIPNAAILVGWAVALLLNGLIPAGASLFVASPGGIGWGGSLLGLAAGLLALMPLYLMRLLGAGDVKLFSVVGAFFGSFHLLGAVLLTFAAGGVLALWMAWRSGTWRVLLDNLRCMVLLRQMRVATGLPGEATSGLLASAGRMPYAIAISAGAAGQALILFFSTRS